MFRFITTNLTPYHNHNAYRIQESGINLACFLQTLALNPNSNTCNNSKNQDNPTVSYLINKCGLPLHSAVIASKQVTLTSTQKADSVLELIKSYGFSRAQMANLISKSPPLIQSDPDKTLKPKFEFFESLGLSKRELARVLSSNRSFLRRSLLNQVVPNLEFLETIKTNKDLMRTLRQWPLILYHKYHAQIEPNLLTLRALGASCLDIYKVLMTNPRLFMVRNEVFQDRVRRFEVLGMDPESLEHLKLFFMKQPRAYTVKNELFEESVRRVQELDIGPKSLGYFRSVSVMLSQSDSLWEKKVNVYKSFGWSDNDVLAAFKKQPHSMVLTEKKIRIMMEFYLNKLGLKASDVANYPHLLMLSLEKTVIPRCLLLQVLLSKGLIIKLNLLSALTTSRTGFEKTFVGKYQEVVPEIESVGQGQKDFPISEAMRLSPLGLYQAQRTIWKKLE